MNDLLLEKHEYIARIRGIGIIWFRVEQSFIDDKCFHARVLFPLWDDERPASEVARNSFENMEKQDRTMRMVMKGVWWQYCVKTVEESPAEVTLIRYDQVEIAVEQPWIASKMREEKE